MPGFTGGIGEHTAEIRQQVCERLQWLGVRIDQRQMIRGTNASTLQNSGVDVRVIPTSEETVIARHCSEILRAQRLKYACRWPNLVLARPSAAKPARIARTRSRRQIIDQRQKNAVALSL